MSEHALLPPSAAGRWVKCALSVSLEAAYPEQEQGVGTIEGTAAHWVNEQMLTATLPALGSMTPQGIPVTEEMLEGAELLMTDVLATLGPNWRQMLFVEKRVQIPRVHADNWGTPDYYAWGTTSTGKIILYLWDYKFGHGLVEVGNNWQLIDYTAGILDQVAASDQEIIVDMRIVQPRAYHRDGPLRKWRVLASDLRAPINRLAMAAEDATSVAPTATPDPEACEHCKGRHACEALQRRGYKIADTAKQYAALELTPHGMGLELRTLRHAQALLEARITGLEAEVEAQIKRGKRVPFWSMESSPGRLSWVRPASEVLALGQMVGVNLGKPVEPITPTQAIKAGIPDDLIKSYAERPSGTAKLLYDDGTKARLTFTSSNT